MYLFARQTLIRGQDAPKWSVDIGAAAAAALNAEVGVWANAFSPGFGTITWTSMWSDLATLEKSLGGLMSDATYLALVGEGQQYIQGAIDDTLSQVVYEGSAPVSDAKYASTVSAVCAPGNFARGMMSGVEIAQKAEQTTGVSTAFLAAQTGPYGAVTWLAGYDGIEAFEAAQHKLEADMSFIEFVDGVTGAYVADPTVTRSTLYVRLN
ncbi:MAG TPA: hypothetical protein VMF33_02180 [Acidimicrobiales bacterium]|nr:hypothetical protein [Acidimicrobiales bacterium]